MNSKYLIILLNYNNVEETLECIDSLKKSNIEDSYILVVENCSTDDSFKILKTQYPQVNIIQAELNLGFTGGNNLGIEYGLKRGVDYVILLNNDTMVTKNSIQILVSEMDKNPEVTLGTGQIRLYPSIDIIWYAGGELIPWRGLAKHIGFGEKGNDTSLKPSYTDFISGCYMCIRTSHIKKLGILNDKFFIYLEDIEYSARAVNKKMKLLYVPNSIIYHKWKGETKLKYRTLYYVVRNRCLLIDLAFPSSAKIYFKIVIFLKMIYWLLTDKDLFKAAKRGLDDYQRNYFGQIRHKVPNN